MNTTKPLYLQYPQCGTCRKATRWLEENGFEVEERNIRNDKPTKTELRQWIERSAIPTLKFFNTSGQVYRDNNLKDKVKTASNDELIEMLASDGMLVKRPILVGEKFVLVGFNEKIWKAHLSDNAHKE